MLRPELDLDLRRTVIWYGEMAQATYDAFNHEKLSPHAGLSRFGRRHFFERVMLPGHAAAYRVTRFLYATSSAPAVRGTAFVGASGRGRRCRESNWIGYVAVATDEGKALLGRRDVVVAWRGTIEALEWVDDLEFVMVPHCRPGASSGTPPAPMPRSTTAGSPSTPPLTRRPATIRTAHETRYQNIYGTVMYIHFDCRAHRPVRAWPASMDGWQVLAEVRKLVDAYKGEEVSITVTGHSLGAALATLSAFDIAENGHNGTFPVTAFAFASPRVGGAGFRKRFDAAGSLRLLRVRNARDIVPRYPVLPYHDVGRSWPSTRARRRT